MVEFIKGLDAEQIISLSLLFLALISFIALKIRQRKTAPTDEELAQEELMQRNAAAEYREMWQRQQAEQTEISNDDDE